MKRAVQLALHLACCACGVSLCAQQGTQPPAYTAPRPSLPQVQTAPGQQTPPGSQAPSIAPDAPLPQTDASSIDTRSLKPLQTQPATPGKPSGYVQQVQGSSARAGAEGAPAIHSSVLHPVAPYRVGRVPGLPAGSTARLAGLVREGKLYLSLHDALALAIENNLDVEVARYSLSLADTDLTRAQGGGTLRGLDYTVQQTAPGVGAATSPLLITATTGNASPTNATVNGPV